MSLKYLFGNSILNNILKSSRVWCIRYMSDCGDIVTHTGQKFEDNDYRLSRFTDKKKLVNPNFSIDLISKVPPKACKSRVVWCDGGGGPTGHPRVYINLDKPGNHTCLYCGLRFNKVTGH